MAYNNKWNKSKQFMSKKEFTDSGVPTKEITMNSDMIQVKAFRDLSFGSTVSVKVDPNTQASRMSQPYAIIARTNTVMDGVYPGEDNLAGVVLEQLMNSNNSKLVNNYDSASLKLKLNYLYLNIDGKASPNTSFGALNREMGNAINEALATTDAEMVTQLPFTLWRFESSTMPSMDKTDRGLALVFYQTILQNIATVLAKYTQLRSLESHLIDMGFRREAPFIHKLFGLLKKASFISILNSLSNYIVGEYFDSDWYLQNNNLSIIPSRKAKCVRHALLSIKAVHKIPNLRLKKLLNQLLQLLQF